MESVPNQEAVWDSIARGWKDFRTKTPDDVRIFLAQKQGRILDCGCGSGRNFVTQEGLEWYGTDFSKSMLRYAQERANDHEFLITLQKAPAWNLPFSNEYFDYALLYCVLHCIETEEERKKTIEELYRVLKRGGQALVSVWGRNSPRVKNRAKESFVSWNTGSDKALRYTYLYDREEIELLCKRVGFEIVDRNEEENITLLLRKPL